MKLLLINAGRDIYIEVDGGINENNVNNVVKAGCNVIVAGSYIFSSGDYRKTITYLKSI